MDEVPSVRRMRRQKEYLVSLLLSIQKAGLQVLEDMAVGREI